VTGLPLAAPDLDRHVIAADPDLAAPVVLARAEWPAGPQDALTPIAGFIVSTFSPLVAEVAGRCLRTRHGQPPADPELGRRTGVVLASVHGDVGTADAIADAVRTGRRVQPLLFFQSNPNAVVGHLAARWGLAGPVVCTSPTGADALDDGLAVAALMLEGGDAAEVLVVAADQGSAGGGTDHAVAVLLGPRAPAAPLPPQPDQPDQPRPQGKGSA
jgi:hypothetical protein